MVHGRLANISCKPLHTARLDGLGLLRVDSSLGKEKWYFTWLRTQFWGLHKRLFAVLSRKQHASNSETTPTCRSCPSLIIGAGVSENKTWKFTLQGVF